MTTKASSIFINRNNKFEQQELPPVAQFTEVHGTSLLDFNQDGIKDLLLCGNNYGVDVNQGKMDAGGVQLLLGKKTEEGINYSNENTMIRKGEFRSSLSFGDFSLIVSSNYDVFVIRSTN